jgi:hypothetical protein
MTRHLHDINLTAPDLSFLLRLTENGTKPGVDGSDLRPNLAFGCGRVNIVDYAFAITDPDNFVTAANLPRIPPCTELDCMLSFFSFTRE